ncbi:FAD-binding oxidoreductase [Halogeometricum sp. S1BR25-6]|uniref:D-lactate dehydrogenase (cytochrome) n=1 Tax=Halogeometricum salsisoli TaxID=2950536 RepID=A0ABU2GLJ6_9EURY|nr:FAD-binding oxidoreductase [Halogeometricum sp. S1BR25-6]MDS0301074.1 FAD-binding oxidoreductase [Halogeometricum sp. S1BR25-6]
MSHADYAFLSELALDGRVEFEAGERGQYAEDASPHAASEPDAVVHAASTDDVSAVLSAADRRGVPVTPRGGGSGLEGGSVPVEGGIVLTTTGIAHVDAHPSDLVVDVGPGVVYDDLNDRLARHGLRFAPGISSGDLATIGGMIATNASGFNAVRYGETRDHIRRLEFVLADGTVLNCGTRGVKTSSGYSLKDLFVGSEGTLGVVTEATLGLVGIPQEKRAALVTFPDDASAARAVAEVIRYGVRPGALEYIDATQAELIDAYSDATDLPAKPTLVVELHGNSAAGVEADLAFVEEMFEENGMEQWTEAERGEMDDVWAARRDALPAARAHREAWDVGVVGDVVVPISAYPDIVATVRSAAEELDLLTPCVGHAGDGNLHYTPLVDPTDEEMVARAHELNERAVRAAVELGGTATGEHGVGLGKRSYMRREHGAAVGVMRRIKRAFDPNGTLNPGKVLPSE